MLLTPWLYQCMVRPDAIALAENDKQITYATLLERAYAIAAALQAMGVRPGQRAAIQMERGIAAAAALFGALLAGVCYVPLDIKNPPERRAFIIKDAGAAVVLGSGDQPQDLAEGTPWFNIDLCPPAQPFDVKILESDLAMILYTSGSTGHPKGVALSHGAVAAFAAWAAGLVKLCPCDRIASSAPFFFDLSTFDLYAVLGRGASLHFVPSNFFLAPARLGAWLQEQKISGWYTVPSLLSFLAYKGNLTKKPPDFRFLLFAGEIFPTPDLLRLANALPHTALYNLFGPTETNVCCCWPVERSRLDPLSAIPIGLPACGAVLEIEPGNGELWVRGPALLSGYWSEGRLHNALNSAGWYPTGDRVSRNERGEYSFHGRLGRMLKCSGYRIEPAEIETVLCGLDGVAACAVVGLHASATGQHPAAALVLEQPLTLHEVRKHVQRQLPSYMQPYRYLVLDMLPRLSNGKVDYLQICTLLEND
ncbi:AMP-binding protein [Candidatus Methylospira mobilis]|uniref:AMP-binding protein n=1 Tax=Candidatus Methylospira mobilis TaxID=1808979 RepID=UPI0028EF1D99|nr:AMP-binding protein [Candidatus Methylospira mobilis]WNV04438.1 AMP-binding protein [Candidatus Methylospira mobilis]